MVVVCVAPEMPLTVTVTGPPMDAVLLAFSVSVLVVVALAGLKVAVTPLGKPEADKLTALLNPFNFFTVMVLVTLLPRPTLRLLGFADKLKSGAGAGALTVRLSVVVWDKTPEVPVTVTWTVPMVAVLLADRVSMLLPVVGLVSNPAETPPGNTEVTASPTLPLNPLAGVTVMVEFPPAP